MRRRRRGRLVVAGRRGAARDHWLLVASLLCCCRCCCCCCCCWWWWCHGRSEWLCLRLCLWWWSGERSWRGLHHERLGRVRRVEEAQLAELLVRRRATGSSATAARCRWQCCRVGKRDGALLVGFGLRALECVHNSHSHSHRHFFAANTVAVITRALVVLVDVHTVVVVAVGRVEQGGVCGSVAHTRALLLSLLEHLLHFDLLLLLLLLLSGRTGGNRAEARNGRCGSGGWRPRWQFCRCRRRG